MKTTLVGFFGVLAIIVALFGYSASIQWQMLPSIPVATSTSALATSTASASTTPAAQAIKNLVVAATTSIKAIQEAVTPDVGWKTGIATVFWVGEGEDSDNGYISNVPSAWDEQWMTHYGGVDSPENRCGFQPCAFTPKENPFYVALPYNDLEDNGDKRSNVKRIPWYYESKKSILKNRWIEVRKNGKRCFGQWQDVGPFHEDDVEYVFGDAKVPLNRFGEKAGIDLSPALAACLGVDGSDPVEWRHVEAGQVPAGDWKKIITTRE